MTTLLRVDASSRRASSYSRALGDQVEARWLAAHPGGRVVRRDVVEEPIAHIAEATITGFYTAPDAMTPALLAATAQSDALIAELKAADALLITTPMYNFGVPSALKAWIDQIVRINATFSYDGASFTGLVTGKPAYVAFAAGAPGYEDGGPIAALDLLRPYLRLLLGFLGFTDIAFVGLEASTADAPTVEAGLARARAAIAILPGVAGDSVLAAGQ